MSTQPSPSLGSSLGEARGPPFAKMGVIVSASLKSNEKPTQGQRKLDMVSGMSTRFLGHEHEASSPTQNCPWELTLPKTPTSLEGQGDEHYHYPQPARDKENGRSM